MTIQFSEIFDLSHPINETMPHWPGDPSTKITPHSTVAADGYTLNSLTIGEHSGTHIGAPVHFRHSGRSIDDIPPDQLVAPAVNIYIEQQAAANRDYLLAADDIILWEQAHGRIEDNSVVLINSGWSSFWNTDTYWGKDESGLHFPGISTDAATFLLQERRIIGLGIDTAGIDGGQSTDFATNILLAHNDVYHLENLNLSSVVRPRLTIVIGALAIRNGSGSPCRVFGFA